MCSRGSLAICRKVLGSDSYPMMSQHIGGERRFKHNNMVTSKHHKTYFKISILKCTFLRQLFDKKQQQSHYTYPHFDHLEGCFSLYVDYCMSNLHRSLSCFFVLVPIHQNIYPLSDISIFRFILVCTWLRRVINLYIIINIMKNNHYP